MSHTCDLYSEKMLKRTLPEYQFELFCQKIGEIDKDKGKQKSIGTQVEVKTKSKETQVEVTYVNKGTQTDPKPKARSKPKKQQANKNNQSRILQHFPSNRARTQGNTVRKTIIDHES